MTSPQFLSSAASAEPIRSRFREATKANPLKNGDAKLQGYRSARGCAGYAG